MNGLNVSGHVTHDPHLVSTKGVALTLEVSHLQTKVSDQLVIQESELGLEMGGHHGSERSSSATEHKLSLGSTIVVVGSSNHCRKCCLNASGSPRSC